MRDTRYLLKHGDPTSTGGQLVAIRPDFTHHGVGMAIEGDIATCPACKSSGPVFNDCNPSYDYHGTQVLVSGARVFCKCADRPVVFNTQIDSTVEVQRQPYRSGPNLLATAPTSGVSDIPESTMQKRTGQALTSNDSADTEQICPNMSNAQFQSHIMGLRDEALLLVEKRLAEIDGWTPEAANWFRIWFGTNERPARATVAAGLSRMKTILAALTPANFIRYSSKSMRAVGCVSREESPGAVAEVCAPDTASHTIAIRLDFCSLRPRHPRFDSQLLTLVHEISHFNDVFGSRDYWYSTHSAKAYAQANDSRTLENADNIAGYVVCQE